MDEKRNYVFGSREDHTGQTSIIVSPERDGQFSSSGFGNGYVSFTFSQMARADLHALSLLVTGRLAVLQEADAEPQEVAK